MQELLGGTTTLIYFSAVRFNRTRAWHPRSPGPSQTWSFQSL